MAEQFSAFSTMPQCREGPTQWLPPTWDSFLAWKSLSTVSSLPRRASSLSAHGGEVLAPHGGGTSDQKAAWGWGRRFELKRESSGESWNSSGLLSETTKHSFAEELSCFPSPLVRQTTLRATAPSAPCSAPLCRCSLQGGTERWHFCKEVQSTPSSPHPEEAAAAAAGAARTLAALLEARWPTPAVSATLSHPQKLKKKTRGHFAQQRSSRAPLRRSEKKKTSSFSARQAVRRGRERVSEVVTRSPEKPKSHRKARTESARLLKTKRSRTLQMASEKFESKKPLNRHSQTPLRKNQVPQRKWSVATDETVSRNSDSRHSNSSAPLLRKGRATEALGAGANFNGQKRSLLRTTEDHRFKGRKATSQQAVSSHRKKNGEFKKLEKLPNASPVPPSQQAVRQTLPRYLPEKLKQQQRQNALLLTAARRALDALKEQVRLVKEEESRSKLKTRQGDGGSQESIDSSTNGVLARPYGKTVSAERLPPRKSLFL